MPLREKGRVPIWKALETLHDTHLYYGHYLAKDKRCSSCGAVWQTYEEKMTDVNIAVELLVDAQG